MEVSFYHAPLYLIDAIGPFFQGDDRLRIDWSKVPWARFEKMSDQELDRAFDQVKRAMRTFCRSVAEIGYNGVTLDDVPHLADHPFYEAKVRKRIALYSRHFKELFQVIQEEGLHLYLTMDVLAFTPALARRLRNSEKEQRAFIESLLDAFFRSYPEVAGVVFRIGENDDSDSDELFRNRLVLKSPAIVNRTLKAVLPIFEKYGRRCIFRTWTVGAQSVGDSIWHEPILAKNVAGIASPALVLSMRCGESDFFRYLPLNRNFFVTDIPTIVELQTRRDYEGCGEFPSFIGRDYEQLAFELREAPNVIGISVQCQTGGLTPFRRLAFIDDSAIWTEINTFVTLRLFRHGEMVEEALTHLPNVEDRVSLIELLRLSEEVITELLYLPDFAKQPVYFRKRRIPPLIGIDRHHIYIGDSLKKIFNQAVDDGEAGIRSARAAIAKIRRMRTLALICHLPDEDIEYMEYTLGIIALAREYFFRPFDDEVRLRLEQAEVKYQKRYPEGSRCRYTVTFDFECLQLKRSDFTVLKDHLLRKQTGHLFGSNVRGIRLLSIAYFALKRTRPKWVPKIARKSERGLDAIFK